MNSRMRGKDLFALGSLFDIVQVQRGQKKLPPLELQWIPPQYWQEEWGRNSTCERCLQTMSFCPSIDVPCNYCNVVAHSTCLAEDEREQHRNDGWVCDDCRVELEEARAHFLERKRAYRDKQVLADAQVKIATLWRARNSSRNYRRVMRSVVNVQAFARKFVRYKHFQQYRLALMRPFRIRILRASDLPIADFDTKLADPYVVMTVLDAKYRQIWRMDTRVVEKDLEPVFNEEFLVAGIPGCATIVFTVVDLDPLRHQFMGQAILRLRRHNLWKDGGRLTLRLHSRQFTPKEAGGFPMRVDFSNIAPQGMLHVQIQPLSSLSNVCGPLLGPSLEELSTTGQGRQMPLATTNPRKLWVMLVDGKLYLHRRFGEQARMVLEVGQLDIHFHDAGRSANHILITTIKGFELPLAAVALNDVQRWRTAFFLSHWRNAIPDMLTPDQIVGLRHSFAQEEAERKAAALAAEAADAVSVSSSLSSGDQTGVTGARSMATGARRPEAKNGRLEAPVYHHILPAPHHSRHPVAPTTDESLTGTATATTTISSTSTTTAGSHGHRTRGAVMLSSSSSDYGSGGHGTSDGDNADDEDETSSTTSSSSSSSHSSTASSDLETIRSLDSVKRKKEGPILRSPSMRTTGSDDTRPSSAAAVAAAAAAVAAANSGGNARSAVAAKAQKELELELELERLENLSAEEYAKEERVLRLRLLICRLREARLASRA